KWRFCRKLPSPEQQSLEGHLTLGSNSKLNTAGATQRQETPRNALQSLSVIVSTHPGDKPPATIAAHKTGGCRARWYNNDKAPTTTLCLNLLFAAPHVPNAYYLWGYPPDRAP